MRELPKKALSVPEAAHVLSVGERTMWRLVHDGKVRSLLVGSRRLIPVAALDEFIEQAGAA